MKLYTEEQMSVAINAAKANPEQAYLIQAMLTPIELPSDEEIDTASLMISKDRKEFLMGAKFVINKIQGGNNENHS